MWGYVVIFGLLLGAFYWILHPLIQEDGRQNDFTPKPEDLLDKLKNDKESAYSAIRELEFDLSMGKLTEEDFSILKHQYLQEAAGYMKEMDILESERATHPKTGDANPGEEIKEETAAARRSESSARKYIYCTACGRKAAVENRFCAACGSNLHQKRGEI